MWLWLSLTALLCWSGSDLFSKIGCRDGSDRYSHLKMVIAVGVVMGLHAAFEIFVGGTAISWSVIWTYLPVSLLYISSMALGYLGLRYIELSVSSPICNSSGALVAVLTLLFVGGEDYSPLALLAIGPAKARASLFTGIRNYTKTDGRWRSFLPVGRLYRFQTKNCSPWKRPDCPSRPSPSKRRMFPCGSGFRRIWPSGTLAPFMWATAFATGIDT